MRVTVPYAALLGLATAALAAFGLAALPSSLEALARARGRLADVERLGAAPPIGPLPLVAGARLKAPDAGQAAAMLRRMLQQEAVRAGVLAEALEPGDGAPDGVVRMRVALSGDGRALLRFAGAVEGRSVRFVGWRLARPTGGAAMRLSGELMMPWAAR